MTLVQSLPGISRWFEVDKRDLVRESMFNTNLHQNNPFFEFGSELPPCSGLSVTAVCCGAGGGESTGERH